MIILHHTKLCQAKIHSMSNSGVICLIQPTVEPHLPIGDVHLSHLDHKLMTENSEKIHKYQYETFPKMFEFTPKTDNRMIIMQIPPAKCKI